MSTKKPKNKHEKMLPQISDSDRLEVDALLLMSKFLEQIEEVQQTLKISRKDLAEKIGTSPSYLTQVFRGNRKLNFETIAKIQKELKVKFNVTCELVGVEQKRHSFISFNSVDLYTHNKTTAAGARLVVISTNNLHINQKLATLDDIPEFAKEIAKNATGFLYRGKGTSLELHENL